MEKLKVGDKIKSKDHGTIGTIDCIDSWGFEYTYDDGSGEGDCPWVWLHEEFEVVSGE